MTNEFMCLDCGGEICMGSEMSPSGAPPLVEVVRYSEYGTGAAIESCPYCNMTYPQPRKQLVIRMAELSERIDHMSEGNHHWYAGWTSLNKAVTAINETIADIFSRLDLKTKQITSNRTRVDSHLQRLNVLEGHEDITEIKINTNITEIERHDERLKVLEEKYDNIVMRLDERLQYTEEKFVTRLNNGSKRSARLEEQVDSLLQKVDWGWTLNKKPKEE